MTESSSVDGQDGTEGLEVSSGGIDLRVRHRVADGGFPAFEYVVTSNRSTSVDVMVTQTLPDAVDPEEIGFPADREERWSVRDDDWMTYERRLQPGATIRTAWGLRRDSHPPLEAPEVHVVVAETAGRTDEGSAPAAGDAAEHRTGTGGDPIGADAGGGPTAGDGDVDDATGEVPDVDHPESPNTVVERVQTLQRDHDQLAEAVASVEDRIENVRDATPTTTEINQLKRMLAALHDATVDREALEEVRERIDALDDGNVGPEAIRDLRGAFSQLEQDAATEEELASLRSEVAELEERAVEASALEDLREELAAIEDRLGDLEGSAVTRSDLADVEETIAAIEDVEGTVAALEDVEETVADLDDGNLSADLEDLEDRVAILAARAASEDALRDVDERLKQVEQGVLGYESLTRRVEELESETAERLDAHGAALSELEDAVADAGDGVRRAVNETRSDVARIETRLESEYADRNDLADAVDDRVRSSVASYVLLTVGASGVLAAGPLAIVLAPLAVLALATGVVFLAAWLVAD